MFFRKKTRLPNIREYRPETELVACRSECVKPNMPVIDAHIHLGPRYPEENFLDRYDVDTLVRDMREQGVEAAVDLELFSQAIFDQVIEKVKKQSDFFHFCAPADLGGFEAECYDQRFRETMDEMQKKIPICGIKVWKNLGLELRRKNGDLARIDDSEFGVIWKYSAENSLPVVMHVADPTAFFKQVDCRNERLEELLQYPAWGYSGKGYPTHKELLQQLEAVLKANPKTVFVIAHICSLPNDLNRVEVLMDRYPNLNVDIAAVLAEIGRQPRRFYRFATKFQDRILFGTDTFAGMRMCYEQYFRYLGTEDEYFEYKPDGDHSQGNWRIYGTNLPETVLRKIYCANAKRIFIERTGL